MASCKIAYFVYVVLLLSVILFNAEPASALDLKKRLPNEEPMGTLEVIGGELPNGEKLNTLTLIKRESPNGEILKRASKGGVVDSGNDGVSSNNGG
ncbi:13329_t:CDS:1, partial [Ambispora gerdemannii]